MGRYIQIVFFIFFGTVAAQTELNNLGNLYIHPNGSLGIHTDLFNDGDFFADSNSLIGFYGDIPNIIGGTERISLFDVEFGNEIGTFLQLRMNVANNANFISGNVVTPPNLEANFLNFQSQSFYTGDSDNGKVIGYAGVADKEEFTFPVGDRDQLRPLILNATVSNTPALCTYVRENPSNPTIVNASFNTESKTRDVGEVSIEEFWILKSEEQSRITLSWNAESNLGSLAVDISSIILVGWSISANQWIPISEANAVGTINEGIITSNTFLPSRYAAITFASTPLPTDTFVVENPTLGNYFITPNGDGTNDFLVFDNLEDTGPNFVSIFNKFGQRVFEFSNYTNEFRGYSNINNAVIMRDIGLPEGVYYYIIEIIEENLQYQGFFFLDR